MTKNKNIPLHEPYFDESEKNIVKDIISSTYVSTVGSYVNKFEKNFTENESKIFRFGLIKNY